MRNSALPPREELGADKSYPHWRVRSSALPPHEELGADNSYPHLSVAESGLGVVSHHEAAAGIPVEGNISGKIDISQGEA